MKSASRIARTKHGLRPKQWYFFRQNEKRFPNEIPSSFLFTERIIFPKASALCCEDGDSFMAALKVSLKCVLAKKTEVSVSSQVRAQTRLADPHVIALAKV